MDTNRVEYVSGFAIVTASMKNELDSNRTRQRITEIIRTVKDPAREYYELTGKPLGVTGEVAEFEASRLLDLSLCGARESGHDALRPPGVQPMHVQIKGRRFIGQPNPGARVGRIDIKNKAWDSVVLVFLNKRFEPEEVWEASRAALEPALAKPGSKARNERGQLSISQFKAVGKQVWPTT